MAMLGMNSSITPLSFPVQSSRPYPWLNWDASRVLAMLEGSYLLQADDRRIIQDPESLRASTQRVGSAWQAWAQLRQAVLIAMNSSDHNPSVRVGIDPSQSWELSTPEVMRFHVKGGPLSHGQSGYILSNANWDPYPLANTVEAFTMAMGNCGVIFGQRIDRFKSTFFTGIRPQDVLNEEQLARHLTVGDYLSSDLAIELNAQLAPIAPQGQAIASGVEDLQAATRQKLDRAENAVDLTGRLIALDLMTSAAWIDVRRSQDPARTFGHTAEAVRRALRGEGRGPLPLADGEGVHAFMTSRQARDFIIADRAPSAPE
jgi:histidine ammonia-lyase